MPPRDHTGCAVAIALLGLLLCSFGWAIAVFTLMEVLFP